MFHQLRCLLLAPLAKSLCFNRFEGTLLCFYSDSGRQLQNDCLQLPQNSVLIEIPLAYRDVRSERLDVAPLRPMGL
jgi:hypothetical protein